MASRKYVELSFNGAVIQNFYRPVDKVTGQPAPQCYAFIRFGGNEIRVAIEGLTAVTQAKYEQLPSGVAYVVSGQFAFAYFTAKEKGKFGEQVIYVRDLRISLDDTVTKDAYAQAKALLV